MYIYIHAYVDIELTHVNDFYTRCSRVFLQSYSPSAGQTSFSLMWRAVGNPEMTARANALQPPHFSKPDTCLPPSYIYIRIYIYTYIYTYIYIIHISLLSRSCLADGFKPLKRHYYLAMGIIISFLWSNINKWLKRPTVFLVISIPNPNMVDHHSQMMKRLWIKRA